MSRCDLPTLLSAKERDLNVAREHCIPLRYEDASPQTTEVLKATVYFSIHSIPRCDSGWRLESNSVFQSIWEIGLRLRSETTGGSDLGLANWGGRWQEADISLSLRRSRCSKAPHGHGEFISGWT